MACSDRIARRVAALGAVAALTGILGTAPIAAAQPAADHEATVATMRQIFESIRVLLPLSVSAKTFAAPEHRAEVESALTALQQNAGALAAHARSDDAGRRYLGGSLARDASEALERYRTGRYEGAAFQIQQTTETCVACHTKLHGKGDSPEAKHFVSRTALAKLPLQDRARLEVATRQFDEASASYEKLLARRDIHPGELLGPLTDYLIVQVRVAGDFDRARRTLQRFATRPDLWRHLRSDVEQWIRALQELEPFAALPPDLASARSLIERARGLVLYPADRRTLIHYLVASSILQRVLDAGPASDREAGEAYYLLGLCETHIGTSYWITQADFYLETAIRLAPKEPFAEEAYVLLEEETLVAYTGNSGEELPKPVAQHLEELRRLIDR
jgi:tetratricopeptide (TPR) repeat protein